MTPPAASDAPTPSVVPDHPPPAGDAALGLHDPLAESFPATGEGRLLFWIAVAFSVFQIATAAHLIDLSTQVVRAVHVGFLLLLAFPLVAAVTGTRVAPLWWGPLWWGMGLLGFAVGLYQWIEYEPLILRAGDLTSLDVAVGTVSLALLFLAAWRVMGIALPIVSGVFLLYCLLGEYLPRPLNHRGYDIAQVVEHMAFGTEGIYGIPTYVSSSYIFLFILFGAFLERAGMIALFNDVSLGLVGRARGGPAQVCVMSSALMGTISGSGVANVVASGQFTIPLMKRFGFKSDFAGGVEAMSSMGGQLMPPVMGAVAFIMAETLGVAYAEIVKAATIPALLYFGSAFWMVHLEAGKRGLAGLPPEECPSALRAIRERWFLILPLAVLVWLLFAGYTPLFAGTIGLGLTAMLILGGAIALGLPNIVVRTIFWVGLALVAAAFFQYGIAVILAALSALVALCAVTRGGRETLRLCLDSLGEGAKTALSVGIACAIVGIVVGTMTLTGAATTFGQFVLKVGETSVILSLVLTMLLCLVLGMGVPTIPNYIITSSLAGPALLALGVPLLVSHMFVFYFGILADLTPPVALAAFAAAPIAKESGMKIGVQATKIALAGFVIPFMAVYTPSLMLQEGGAIAERFGYFVEVAYIVAKACLAIGLWGAAAVGFLVRPMGWIERLLAAAAAGFLIAGLPVSDEIGFALAALLIGWHVWRARGATPARMEGTVRP